MNQQAAALAAAAALSQQQSRINAIAQTTARESAIQKAAAAKLALRRQLEQQLLQVDHMLLCKRLAKSFNRNEAKRCLFSGRIWLDDG